MAKQTVWPEVESNFEHYVRTSPKSIREHTRSENSAPWSYRILLLLFLQKTLECTVEVGKIFGIPGFLKSYSEFIDATTENSYLSCSELRDNPAIRGKFDKFFVEDQMDGGFEKCFSHVHKRSDECHTIGNYVMGMVEGTLEYNDL